MTAADELRVTGVPGSFRDPRARVYQEGQRILRGLNEQGMADFEAVLASGLLHDLIPAGKVIGTTVSEGSELAADGWAGTLVHDRVPVITYPYEWTFSMLRDAALLQLEIVRRGLACGISCKDGTPYNVQFRGTDPVFIDVGSFEPTGPDAWPGYRQFCQLFLYPLLVEAYLGVSFGPFLRGSLEGITPDQADRLLRGRIRLRKGVLAHVTAQAFAARRYADRPDPARSVIRADGEHIRVVDALVRRLESLIAGLPAPAGRSEWSDYEDRSHYSARSLAAKDAFVDRALERSRPALVVDLGCNDGRYARASARYGSTVLALDADRRVVDRLYLAHRTSPCPSGSILPSVADLADPSPSLGWALAERPGLRNRIAPDLVVCLALVHHLVIGRSIPVASFLDSLAGFAPDVVLEVPHRDDEKVLVLLEAKPADTHLDYDEASIGALIEERFTVVEREELPGGTRTLLHLRRRL